MGNPRRHGEASGEALHPPHVRDAFLRPVGEDCKILQGSSEGMESVEQRSALGEDDEAVPALQRVLVAGGPYDPCDIRGGRGADYPDVPCI